MKNGEHCDIIKCYAAMFNMEKWLPWLQIQQTDVCAMNEAMLPFLLCLQPQQSVTQNN